MPWLFQLLCGLGLFAAMFLSSRLAYRIGLRKNGGADGQFAVIETSTLGLVALLVAFSFNVSFTRFEQGRNLLVQEANAVEAVYMRLEMLNASDQPDIRRLLRSYVATRLRIFDSIETGRDYAQDIAQARQLQDEIWATAIQSVHQTSGPAAAILLMPAISQMIEVANSRFVLVQTQTPVLVRGLLVGLAIISSLVIGYAMGVQKLHSYVPAAIFSIVVSAAIYTILDLDNPHFGLVRYDAAAQALRDVNDKMRAPDHAARLH